MERRDLVEFQAEFPDDSEWDGDFQILPAGRAIIEAIWGRLQEKGITCSKIDEHSDYGWTFDATSKNSIFCRILTSLSEDGTTLVLEEIRTLMGFLFGSPNDEGFEDVQRRIHEVLTSDQRFSNVMWHTRDDYGKRKPGFPTPRG